MGLVEWPTVQISHAMEYYAMRRGSVGKESICCYLIGTSGLGSEINPSRFGIRTAGSERASITVLSSTMPFRYSSQAMSEYTSSGVSDCGDENGMAR